MSDPVRVAVGVIRNLDGDILITQRSLQATHAGFWEFPGGKLEDHERPEDALCRELKEEVGIDVLAYSYWDTITHCYDDRWVSLMIYQVSQYRGEAACLESQLAFRWVPPEQLHLFQFPEANRQIIDKLTADK